MKARELAAVLRLLERYPRVTSFALGDLRLTFGDLPPPVPTEGGEDDRDESLELPAGVPDPRDRIRAIYAKALKRDGKVPS